MGAYRAARVYGEVLVHLMPTRQPRHYTERLERKRHDRIRLPGCQME